MHRCLVPQCVWSLYSIALTRWQAVTHLFFKRTRPDYSPRVGHLFLELPETRTIRHLILPNRSEDLASRTRMFSLTYFASWTVIVFCVDGHFTCEVYYNRCFRSLQNILLGQGSKVCPKTDLEMMKTPRTSATRNDIIKPLQQGISFA